MSTPESVLQQLMDYKRRGVRPVDRRIVHVLQGRWLKDNFCDSIRKQVKIMLPEEAWGSARKYADWEGDVHVRRDDVS